MNLEPHLKQTVLESQSKGLEMNYSKKWNYDSYKTEHRSTHIFGWWAEDFSVQSTN
jgi:hypothetical protein